MDALRLRREARLFKRNKRTTNTVHRKAFRQAKFMFTELVQTERERQARK
jgi:hypothetical protein